MEGRGEERSCMMAEEGGEEEDWEVVEEEEGGSSGAFPRSGSSASTAIHVPAAASNPNAPTARYEYLHPREELRRRESEARPPPKYTAEE